MVSEITKYYVYTMLELRSVYHQVAIKPENLSYTAFGENGQLYQFQQVSFRITNGITIFQRIINRIISSEKLDGTFACIDKHNSVQPQQLLLQP